MFSASKLFKSLSSSSVLSMTGYSFNSSPVNAGTTWGGTATVSGGVAPYTYALLYGAALQYQTTTSSLTSFVGGGAIQSWNGGSMRLRVTDSLGAVVLSPFQAIAVYYINSISVSLSSYSPAVGTFVSCSVSVSANPAPSSYAWKYRQKPPGGSWGSWTAFGGSSATVYTGSFTVHSEQWEFRCMVTNAAGSIEAYSSTLTVA